MTTEIRIARAGLALALAVSAFAIAAPANAAADWAKGRTFTYIVATAAGGGYDGYGRLTARYMEKHLPGSTFVVVNRPGAGHLIGTNLIYAAKPDGHTMGTFNMGVLYSQLTGKRAARFDLGKMSWIGKAAADTRVMMVAIQSPLKSFTDLMNAKEPVPFAVSGVGSAAYTELQLLRNVFDLRLKLLSGYSGSEDDMAMMRGELVGKLGTISGQGAFVRSGRGRFILQVGGSRKTLTGETTYAADVAKTPEQKAVIALIASQSENSRVTAGPAAIPEPRLTDLRNAYRAAFTDPALLADAAKLHYEIDPAVGEEVATGIRAALHQPPRIVALLAELQNAKPKGSTVTVTLTAVENGGRAIAFRDGGKDAKAKLSGSRSRIEIGGKGAKRNMLKPGMSCEVTYAGPGSEASLVACK